MTVWADSIPIYAMHASRSGIARSGCDHVSKVTAHYIVASHCRPLEILLEDQSSPQTLCQSG